MRRAIYPGSFDPVTNGHLDVIERARKLFDEIVVAVAHNDEKQPLFSLQERLDLLRETAGKINNVRSLSSRGYSSSSPGQKKRERSSAACAQCPISSSNFKWP